MSVELYLVSLLSVAATHPEIKPMAALRDAPEPEEAFLSEVSMPERPELAESPFKDSETAIVGRRAAYARLSVESLSAVC